MATQESRRLFGLPGDDESLTPEPQVLVCRRSMSGRRLSLNLGLLDGNDAPLIKKQLKRCVSIHGNIRQVQGRFSQHSDPPS
jgi:hypothetical protein